MPTFATPEPITLRINSPEGDIKLEASDRQDTEVEVLPSKPGRSQDVELAEQTQVEHRNGTVVVEVPDEHRRRFGRSGSVDIRVALPEGSQVRIHTASADVHATGRYGDVELDAASADVQIGQTADLTVQCASGGLYCREVDGELRATSASGEVRVERVRGNAQVSTASGDASLGEVHGDLRVNIASGDARVDVANGSVTGKAASGDLRIGSVRRGHVQVDGASGDVAIGVASGTAAWLDVSSLSGDVASSLDQTERPGESDETVEIRVRTISGDVVINRA